MTGTVCLGCHYKWLFLLRKRMCDDCPFQHDYAGCVQHRAGKKAIKFFGRRRK